MPRLKTVPNKMDGSFNESANESMLTEDEINKIKIELENVRREKARQSARMKKLRRESGIRREESSSSEDEIRDDVSEDGKENTSKALTATQILANGMKKADYRFKFNVKQIERKYRQRAHIPESKIEMDLDGNFYFPENMNGRKQQVYLNKWHRQDEAFGKGLYSTPHNSLQLCDGNKQSFKKCEFMNQAFSHKLNEYEQFDEEGKPDCYSEYKHKKSRYYAEKLEYERRKEFEDEMKEEEEDSMKPSTSGRKPSISSFLSMDSYFKKEKNEEEEEENDDEEEEEEEEEKDEEDLEEMEIEMSKLIEPGSKTIHTLEITKDVPYIPLKFKVKQKEKEEVETPVKVEVKKEFTVNTVTPKAFKTEPISTRRSVASIELKKIEKVQTPRRRSTTIAPIVKTPTAKSENQSVGCKTRSVKRNEKESQVSSAPIPSRAKSETPASKKENESVGGRTRKETDSRANSTPAPSKVVVETPTSKPENESVGCKTRSVKKNEITNGKEVQASSTPSSSKAKSETPAEKKENRPVRSSTRKETDSQANTTQALSKEISKTPIGKIENVKKIENEIKKDSRASTPLSSQPVAGTPLEKVESRTRSGNNIENASEKTTPALALVNTGSIGCQTRSGKKNATTKEKDSRVSTPLTSKTSAKPENEIVRRSSKRLSQNNLVEGPENKKIRVEKNETPVRKKAEKDETKSVPQVKEKPTTQLLDTCEEESVTSSVSAQYTTSLVNGRKIRKSDKLIKKDGAKMVKFWNTVPKDDIFALYSETSQMKTFFGINIEEIEKGNENMIEFWLRKSVAISIPKRDSFETDFRRYLSKHARNEKDFKAGYDLKIG